jgi:hypothetical protein
MTTNGGEAMKLWSEISKLEGKTLRTLDRNRPFDVVKVGVREVIVRPHVRGIVRTIHRDAIEDAFSELAARGKMARTDIRNRYSDFNPAYIAAMLAALPGVKVFKKPIRLEYSKAE